MIRTLVASVLFLVFSTPAFATDVLCGEVRGILDVGSGATKMKVALVDHCTQKIIKILADDSIKVAYSADLKKSKDQKFSPEIQAQGLAAIETLVKKGNEQKPSRWFGIATSAFRTAKNGAEVLAADSKKTGIPLQVISQDQEGALGFAAGVQVAKVPANEVVVWDIGGGSQQFAFRRNAQVQVIKLEEKASENFKEVLIHEVKKEDSKITTPNPIGAKNLKAAVAEAKKFAITVKFPFQPKEVIGIGGVHAKSFEKTLKGKSPYTVSDLAKASRGLAVATDADLKDDYADTQVSNLILVQGMMEQLKIKSVTVSKFGGAEGALVYPDFWK
jgi:exopolyphosphatase/guanosine-5'-triphosphate,3'-diphosphate pyrophosphatase